MKIAEILLALVFLGVVVFALMAKKSSAKRQAENYCINLFLPLAGNREFDPQDLMVTFKQMWGMNIICAQPDGESTDNERSTKYIVGNGLDKNNLCLTWTREPLNEERTELLIDASKSGFTNNEPITQADLEMLINHKSYFQLDYIHGKVAPIERVIFTAKLLLTLCKSYSACGIVNASAQSYISTSRIEGELFGRKDFAAPDLFPLFVNIQLVSEDQQIDLHTHGMDQFWLPDIQMRFSVTENSNYNYDVICNAAVYMIENGKAMNVGDTTELASDGKIFKVITIRERKDHPFGFFGVIGLREEGSGRGVRP